MAIIKVDTKKYDPIWKILVTKKTGFEIIIAKEKDAGSFIAGKIDKSLKFDVYILDGFIFKKKKTEDWIAIALKSSRISETAKNKIKTLK